MYIQSVLVLIYRATRLFTGQGSLFCLCDIAWLIDHLSRGGYADKQLYPCAADRVSVCWIRRFGIFSKQN